MAGRELAIEQHPGVQIILSNTTTTIADRAWIVIADDNLTSMQLRQQAALPPARKVPDA